ncbi:MAG TPA: NAD(P)/FAD-dependent oxidoreductase [Polyangiaceae bacterium]|nr:NAD(P)/FAD-dependent oxidoreductase [Polyangiaceae bacterium]
MGLTRDVLVLGAGMAGLSAARELCHRGVSVTVLEARARAGGRILTEDVPGWATPVELGAEFVHGRPRELFALIDAAGLTRVSTDAPHLRKAALGLDERATDFWSEIDKALQTIAPGAPDVSATELIASGALPPGAAQMLAAYLEGFHAGEVDRISMQSVVRQISEDDAEQGRIREGYGRLVEYLQKDVTSSGAKLVLKARVSVLRWEPGSVVAVADDVEFRAKAAVVALPLSALKARAPEGVDLAPEPEAVRRGLDALEMGQALRVVLRFAEKVGLVETLRPGSFVHGIEAEFPTFWLGPAAREVQITMWCGGPRAIRLGELDAHSIVAAALRSAAVGLDASLPLLEGALLGAHVHAFGSDPFSRGAYPYALKGGDASRAFEPVSDTLFFAGDYTVAEELGTVGIAVRSGVRAAHAVLEALKR